MWDEVFFLFKLFIDFSYKINDTRYSLYTDYIKRFQLFFLSLRGWGLFRLLAELFPQSVSLPVGRPVPARGDGVAPADSGGSGVLVAALPQVVVVVVAIRPRPLGRLGDVDVVD